MKNILLSLVISMLPICAFAKIECGTKGSLQDREKDCPIELKIYRATYHLVARGKDTILGKYELWRQDDGSRVWAMVPTSSKSKDEELCQKLEKITGLKIKKPEHLPRSAEFIHEERFETPSMKSPHHICEAFN